MSAKVCTPCSRMIRYATLNGWCWKEHTPTKHIFETGSRWYFLVHDMIGFSPATWSRSWREVQHLVPCRWLFWGHREGVRIPRHRKHCCPRGKISADSVQEAILRRADEDDGQKLEPSEFCSRLVVLSDAATVVSSHGLTYIFYQARSSGLHPHDGRQLCVAYS